MSNQARATTTFLTLSLASLTLASLAACGDSGTDGNTDGCQPGTFCACTTSADCPSGEECSAVSICVPTTTTDAGDDVEQDAATDAGDGDTTVEDTTDTSDGDTTVEDVTDAGDGDATVEDTTDTSDGDTTVEDTTDTTDGDTTVEDTTDTTVPDTDDGVIDNPWIAFVSVDDATSRDRIEFIRADGTGRTTLSAAGELDRAENVQSSPAWSPDGTRLAYLGRASGGATTFDLRVIDFESGDETTIPTSLTYHADISWSPDGTQLVFTADTDLVGVPLRSLYRAAADGTGSPTLIALSPAGDASPQWASDNVIWHTSSENNTDPNNIYSINADGTGRTAITSFSSARIFSGISLSADETEIAYGGDSGIVLYDIADDDDSVVGNDGDSEPDFFPDAERIVINRQFDLQIDLVVIERNGDLVLRLTNDSAPDGSPDVANAESADVDITNF